MENPTFQKANSQITDNKEIPLWQKYTLTVGEASRYYRIGQAKLRRIINESENAEFLNFIRESKEYSPYYWMFEFFFETGCRSGEGTGLLWGNIDFRKKFIKIGHQLLYELDEEGKRRFQICPPKTIKGIRKIPLTAKALYALKKQKEYMLKQSIQSCGR